MSNGWNILVNQNTNREAHFDESIRLLEYLGYTIRYYNDHSSCNLFVTDEDSAEKVYVIDRRTPNWRGWRDIVSSLEWKHRDKIREFNLSKGLDKVASCVLEYSDDNEDTCFS